jgi:hypothetical protein
MDLVDFIIKTEEFMKGIGRIILNLGLEQFYFQIPQNLLDFLVNQIKPMVFLPF